jgi:hypothetical protein
MRKMEEKPERRKEPEKSSPGTVTIFRGEREITGEIINLSPIGALLALPEDSFSEGEAIECITHFTVAPNRRCRGTVIRKELRREMTLLACSIEENVPL